MLYQMTRKLVTAYLPVSVPCLKTRKTARAQAPNREELPKRRTDRPQQSQTQTDFQFKALSTTSKRGILIDAGIQESIVEYFAAFTTDS